MPYIRKEAATADHKSAARIDHHVDGFSETHKDANSWW
jgi:hypothetical protein